jgi:hypothetical protein
MESKIIYLSFSKTRRAHLIWYLCFIPHLRRTLKVSWSRGGLHEMWSGKQTKLCAVTYRLMFHLFITQNVNFQWLAYVKGIFDECGHMEFSKLYKPEVKKNEKLLEMAPNVMLFDINVSPKEKKRYYKHLILLDCILPHKISKNLFRPIC